MTHFYPAHRISPGAISTAAEFYHYYPTAITGARVLELGCGAGKTMLAHAIAWPQSIVIGVDIDEEAVACGQRLIEKAAVKNIELFCASLPDLLAAELGEFDYIIVRGLFSLVGPQERQALLKWCHAHLSDSGVIGFHWYTLPGSRDAKVLQEAIGFHAGRAADETAQLSSARGMLSYLAMTLPEGTLKQQVQSAEQDSDLSIGLRYLNNFNEVSYLTDFYQQITESGFQYVGDLLPQSELAHFYAESVRDLHSVIVAERSPVNAQQYLDFAIDRRERFSLLGKTQSVTQCCPPDLKALEKLHWAGNFKRRFNEDGVTLNGHYIPGGVCVHSGDKATLQVLDLLGAVWPLSLSFEQLLFHTTSPAAKNDAREALVESLNDLFIKNIDGLFYSTTPGAYNQSVELDLTSLVSFNAAEVDPEIVNLWGQSVNVTDEEHGYLCSEMKTDSHQDWELFSSLRGKGLLTGSAQAWQKILQRFIAIADAPLLSTLFPSLLIISSASRFGGFALTGIVDEAAPKNDEYDGVYREVNALNEKGEFTQSRAYIEKLLENDSDNIHLLLLQSRTCLLMGAWKDALLFTGRLLAYHAQNWDVWFDLATSYYKDDNLLAAEHILQALLRIDKKNASCWNLLACLCHARREMALAEKCARESIRYDATVPFYLAIMGIILSDNQKLVEARYFLEKALELKGLDFDSYTSLLFVLTHDHTVDASTLFKKHVEYGLQVSRWVEKKGLNLPHYNLKDPDRKLRVGFVSGDFRNHPVANFLKPFWDNIDREKYDLIGYSTLDKEDEVTKHFVSSAALWQKVMTYNDVELAQTIHRDNIDILIDLSGHTTGTRLPMFGFKPAPVQMTWMGYPGTSGIPAVDYRITSTGFARPGEMDEQYTEKLIYIPMRCFFEPSPLSPEINPLPALQNGYVTYGSLNRPSKINAAVFELWAKILRHNYQAKIIIGFMDDETMIAQYRKKMLALGVLDEQLIFRKTTGLENYLRMHHEIDILLDTFPYTGGTTTNHGVWMGVPTLTIAGETPSARQGVETLNLYGLGDFIAADREDYFAKAIAWQTNINQLNELRQNIRQSMPINHEPGFNVAASFERALRQAWHIYCAGDAARSFTVTE